MGMYVGRNKEGRWRGRERERERESVKVIIFEWKLSEREVGEPWQGRKEGRREGQSCEKLEENV